MIDEIIKIYGFKEGLNISGETITKWPYSEPEPAGSDLDDIISAGKISSLLDGLYESCMAYQVKPGNIDTNTKSELDKAESLWENGNATPSDLPIAEATADWLEVSLWGSPDAIASADGPYFARKNQLLAGGDVSLDFSDIGVSPHSFIELRQERKAFLTA